MQKYVVDLETAKKLKDYLPEGFRSIFYWKRKRDQIADAWGDWYIAMDYFEPDERWCCVPAPILEEMLELLPEIIYVGKVPHYLNIRQKDHEKEINYIKYPHGLHGNFESETFTFTFDVDSKSSYHHGDDIYKHICTNGATAAAKLYMWLVDEGYHIP
jgi:hypothetical protein